MQEMVVQRLHHRLIIRGSKFLILCLSCFFVFGCSYSYSILKPPAEKHNLQLVIDSHLVNDTENGRLLVDSLKEAFSESFQSIVVSSEAVAAPKSGELILAPQNIKIRTWEESSPRDRNSYLLRHYAEATVDFSTINQSEKKEHTVSSQGCMSIFLPPEYVITWPINLLSLGANLSLTLGTLGLYEKAYIEHSYKSATQTSLKATAIEFHNQYISSH